MAAYAITSTTRTAHYGSPADVDAVRESVEQWAAHTLAGQAPAPDVGDGRVLFGERSALEGAAPLAGTIDKVSFISPLSTDTIHVRPRSEMMR